MRPLFSLLSRPSIRLATFDGLVIGYGSSAGFRSHEYWDNLRVVSSGGGAAVPDLGTAIGRRS